MHLLHHTCYAARVAAAYVGCFCRGISLGEKKKTQDGVRAQRSFSRGVCPLILKSAAVYFFGRDLFLPPQPCQLKQFYCIEFLCDLFFSYSYHLLVMLCIGGRNGLSWKLHYCISFCGGKLLNYSIYILNTLNITKNGLDYNYLIRYEERDLFSWCLLFEPITKN